MKPTCFDIHFDVGKLGFSHELESPFGSTIVVGTSPYDVPERATVIADPVKRSFKIKIKYISEEDKERTVADGPVRVVFGAQNGRIHEIRADMRRCALDAESLVQVVSAHTNEIVCKTQPSCWELNPSKHIDLVRKRIAILESALRDEIDSIDAGMDAALVERK